MTTAKSFTATVLGVDAHIVEVEADISIGLGNFNIVGLPDGAIRESRDRITAALNNATDGFPVRKIVVNLAPADLKKSGSGFDLPIAMAILEAWGVIPKHCLENSLLIGELALDGGIRPIEGIIAVAMAAKKAGIHKFVVPHKNGVAISLIGEVEIYPVENIQEVVRHFNGENVLPPQVNSTQKRVENHHQLDFQDVKGQITAKRALEIAAAGRHNVLFSGPPGSGKSMLSKRLPSILPPLSDDEVLEVTKIHSIGGTLSKPDQIIYERPFRNPHHSVSSAGIVGGGTYPKPGEISLAHHGVLFLDELPEFPRYVLDLLRQPLEDKGVTISRANISLFFPSDFLLLAAMNPCPCGFLGDKERDCTCSAGAILRYRSKISGPMIDRIDLQIEMPALSYDELNFSPKGEKSRDIRERVLKAREKQEERFKGTCTHCNSGMQHQELEDACQLNNAGHDLLSKALKKYSLSSRAHDSVLKVTRTIADLENSTSIEVWHLAEALNYRCLDKEINL